MQNTRKAYLFDFDGTLVNTMWGFADIAGQVINKYHPEISFESGRRQYLETSGLPFFEQLGIILPGDPRNKEIAKEFEDTKISGFFRQHFEHDVRYAINSLRARGDLAAITSNNFQYLIDEFVSREGLVFDEILGFRENFTKGKQHFNYIIEKYDLVRTNVTFVGDSLKDAEKAIEAKVGFVGICGTFESEDFLKAYDNISTINNIKELLDL